MHELRGAPEPALADLVKHVAACDLLLIEGFKHAAVPKLEVYRSVVGESLLHPQDAHVVAVASDRPVETQLPQFRLDDAAAIAAFIAQHAAL